MLKKVFKYQLLIILLLVFSACSKPYSSPKQAPQNTASNQNIPLTPKPVIATEEQETIQIPISNALDRITKKPFGIKVSPNNSPVTPEKFSGYHTGVDFETFANEQDTDVNIYAICNGEIILKRFVSGYGGAVVQKCVLNETDFTVIYGHLKLSSITPELNKKLNRGDQIGILGKGYSTETDGERKHLHLGIHKGNEINLLGYVNSQDLLNNWINPVDIF